MFGGEQHGDSVLLEIRARQVAPSAWGSCASARTVWTSAAKNESTARKCCTAGVEWSVQHRGCMHQRWSLAGALEPRSTASRDEPRGSRERCRRGEAAKNNAAKGDAGGRVLAGRSEAAGGYDGGRWAATSAPRAAGPFSEKASHASSRWCKGAQNGAIGVGGRFESLGGHPRHQRGQPSRADESSEPQLSPSSAFPGQSGRSARAGLDLGALFKNMNGATADRAPVGTAGGSLRG